MYHIITMDVSLYKPFLSVAFVFVTFIFCSQLLDVIKFILGGSQSTIEGDLHTVLTLKSVDFRHSF